MCKQHIPNRTILEMASRHSYKENIAGSIAKSEVDPQSRKLINLLGGC